MILFLALAGCRHMKDSMEGSDQFPIADNYFHGTVKFTCLSNEQGIRISLEDSSNRIIDHLVFHYLPYRFDTADVNHDGKTDLLLGVVKSTEFDPQIRKRLFIIRIDEGQLRPLWLGSRVCQDLVDFRTRQHGIVETLEQTKAGAYSIGRYRWGNFGLELIGYSIREKTYSDALQYFKD